ncbi:MAG: peptide MFS transporter [Bacteroidia bacterium]|nr:peptide MFS transporter [Bacteroidia bacterium]
MEETTIPQGQDHTLNSIQNFEGQYPKQLWSLFFSEMWERFCFYGMRGMLTLFMVQQLMMDEKTANLQYGATQAFVYAFTFIGGLFADKILGFRKSLFWGGLLMIAGSCILAIDPKQFFFVGISFTIVGTGFFKPNISTMVGSLYKEGDSRRDAGFSLFYSGINIGALLGGYLCITVAKNYSWNLAFGFAAIVMSISLLTFLYTKRHLGPIGLSPFIKNGQDTGKKWYDILVYIGTLAVIPAIMSMVSTPEYTDLFMYIVGPATLLYLGYEMSKLTWKENKKIIAAMVFILYSILFWAFFEQSGGSLSLFAANNLDNTVLGLQLDPNGVNNSSNSLFVIVFAPLLGLVWVWLDKRRKEPNTVIKFGLGFIFLSLAFYTFYTNRFFANSEGIASLDIFTLAYLIITFGELCLSPIGLSIMTKLAPKHLAGVMMGLWFLASAYGQYVAGILGAGMASESPDASKLEKLISYTDGYKQLGIYALISGLTLILISPWVKKMMQEIK